MLELKRISIHKPILTITFKTPKNLSHFRFTIELAPKIELGEERKN